MLTYLWAVFVFVIGTVVGSFLNVCIARLPLDKSVLWPNSRCGKCFQPIAWYDNVPLLGYLWLRGRCRRCGSRYSVRYLLVELLTGLGFVGLYYAEVVANVHGWPLLGANAWDLELGLYPWQWWVGYAWHALLFCLLLVASVCDLDARQIPLSLTLAGSAVGLAGALLLPWPWPQTPDAALAEVQAAERRQAENEKLLRMGGHEPVRLWWLPPVGWADPNVRIGEGAYPWPAWGPLPSWAPAGDWRLGLLTGLAGLLAGTFLVRAVAWVFGLGLGQEALGLGDADLMMMAGAFLGWQAVVVAFLISVFPALLVGLFQVLVRGDNSLPFGPSLALGVMATMLGWRWVAPQVQVLLFWPALMLGLIGAAAGFLLLASFTLRILRR